MICWNISFECECPPCQDDYKEEEDEDDEEESDDDEEVHDPNLPAMLAVILSTLWWNLYHCSFKQNSQEK